LVVSGTALGCSGGPLPQDLAQEENSDSEQEVAETEDTADTSETAETEDTASDCADAECANPDDPDNCTSNGVMCCWAYEACCTVCCE